MLKRIPEHFEEVFYEVAMVTLPNGDRVKTMEYDEQIIPGVCFDLDLIVFVLTEHFCYNIGSEESALDYAFMFSAIESCDINRLSPETFD